MEKDSVESNKRPGVDGKANRSIRNSERKGGRLGTIPSKDVSICRRVRVSSRLVSLSASDAEGSAITPCTVLVSQRDLERCIGFDGMGREVEGAVVESFFHAVVNAHVPKLPAPGGVPYAKPLATPCVYTLEDREYEREAQEGTKECVNRDRLHGMFVVQIKVRDKKPRS
jgi:hypothetical protein